MINQMKFENIGKLLWSIMPLDAEKIIYEYMYYPEFNQGGAHWLTNDGVEHYFDEPPLDIYKKLSELIEQLHNKQNNMEQPNHFFIELDTNSNLNIKFAYIEEEDSWPGLFMKGVSDLTKEEADDKYYIPLDIWEERVRLKKEKE